MLQDHYRVLSVSPDATHDDIQRSYRALARRYHPDRNPLSVAANRMADINAAYEILGEPAKRAAYDRSIKKKDPAIENAVLNAARETLMRQNWKVTEDQSTDFVLKNGSRKVRVCLSRSLSDAALQKYMKQSSGFQ